MKKNRSFKKEILRFLLASSTLIVLIVGLFAILNTYTSKIKLISHNQNLILKQANKEIDNLVFKIENLSRYLSKEYSKNKALIEHIVNTDNNISSILILNKNGLIEDFYSLSNKNVYKGFDYSKKVYFQQLKHSDRYWSNVFLSTINEEPTISFSFKMESKVGVFLINLSTLSGFINQFKNYDETHSIRIFDKNGIMIINPDHKEMTLQRFNGLDFEVFTKLINKEKEFTHVIYKSAIENHKEFGAYTKSNMSNWTIIVRENYNNILESIMNVVVIMVLMMLFFILLSIYLTIKVSRGIFDSLDDVQVITSNIANGNYNSKIQDLHYYEFNSLLDSFNKMQLEINKREYSLEESLNSFKSLINSTMEAIILHENGICTDINDVCLKLFNAKNKDEFINRSVLDIVAPSYKDLVSKNYFMDDEPIEVELIKKDITKIEALVQNKTIIFQERELKIFTIIDISELKSKDRLLYHQAKMASLGEMLENIAHQWRQPLSAISINASTAILEKKLETLTDEDFDNYMDNITKSTLYLSDTIDDFRNYFKPEKESASFLLKDTIQSALSLSNAKLVSVNVEVKKLFLKNSFNYYGFKNEFIQVLINILNNAVDIMLLREQDKKYIEIEEELQHDKYILKIKDNAGGIDNHIIDKIFEPYFTTKHKSQGTGIGLYMSSQIINEHMNGKIYAQNIEIMIDKQLYNGACFIIELPIKHY